VSFSVSNGKIIGPNGQPFIAKGTAVYDDVDLPSAVNAFTTTLPGINFIRMTNFNLSEDTVAYLTPYINQLTSEGIAVEIQDTNYPNVFTGSALTSAEQWYASFATAFENNPYVWFDTQNEPTGGDVTDDQNEIVGIYNAIRATGNNNIIMMDPGGNTIPGMNPAVFATMTNVAWDEHYYNWESGYSTSLAANEAKLSSDIATMQSITSANGTIPVIVGEYGNSTDGSNVDPGGSQTLQAVQDSVTSGQTSGAISWEWYNSGTQADNMVNSVTGGSASLSSYGQEVAQWIASATGPSGGGTTSKPSPSPSGTTIKSASAAPIIDQNGNAWSLVQSASSGLQIAVNGTVDAPTANVVLLETLKGAMVQENSSGNWYSETTPNDSWTQITDPNPAPVVSTITTSPGSGDLTVGATLILTVTFSSAVIVAGGTPALALNDGGVAIYVSGSGSSALVFKYTVAAGQNIADLTSAASSAITLNGATIRGTSGSNAVLTGANGYNPAGILQIDTTAPTVSAIAESPGSGQVATGGTVTLTATFSEAVTVAGGTPTLALNDGGTATYLSGSGSSALAFKYTVAAGQSTTDLKLAASNAVALNGGTIRDAAGNNTVLTGANGYTPAGTLAINPTASPPATNDFLIMPGSGTFKDAAGNAYSLDSSQNAIENGKDIPGGGGTSAMAYFNGTVLGQDAGGTGWYTWNQTNWQPDAPNVSDVTSAGTLTESLSQTGTFAENGDTFVLSTGNVLKATLGSGKDNVGFVGPQQVVLTGGSGTATVLAAGGNNTFTAGSGSLDVTAGAGKDAYVFHTTSGLLTLEDFSLAKGDTLTIDKALQGSLHQASDGVGGTMLTFGTSTSHGVDIRGLVALPSSNIVWA
jgi:Cellulase (glycosyl hydrolase family 5)